MTRYDDEDDDANARADRARKGTPFLTTSQAAFYIGVHRVTLETMRRQGTGPRFRRHARFIRYHIDDLEQWSIANGGTPPKGRSDA